MCVCGCVSPFARMHSQTLADIDTIPLQVGGGPPISGHRPIADPGGYPGAARGAVLGLWHNTKYPKEWRYRQSA